MRNLNWKEIFPNLLTTLASIKKLQCNDSLVYEIKELLSMMNAKRIGTSNFYISPYRIKSVNLDVELHRTFKGSIVRNTMTICGVMTDPEKMNGLLYDIQEFISGDCEDFYYAITGTVAIVEDNFLYHAYVEQECGIAVHRIPV